MYSLRQTRTEVELNVKICELVPFVLNDATSVGKSSL